MFDILKRKKTIDIFSPVDGDIIPLDDVEDEVFSQKMLGDGVAVKPSKGVIVSPCNGKVIQVFPRKHAIGIKTKEGIELLIHIGLDTVELKGEGFEQLINEGEEVKIGDRLLNVDLDLIKNKKKSIITPIVITNMDIIDNFNSYTGNVKKGEGRIMTIKVKK